MKARAVIGANFGDEGKGLVTDYLAAQGGDVVVRFNGGAQAGHTVITPNNTRHVFSHFGSGTFAGLPTYLSKFFIVNPILFLKELGELTKTGINRPAVYVHPDCLVTTYNDMNRNQDSERTRGVNNHGSCGVGVFETIKRSRKHPLRMRDLWDMSPAMRTSIHRSCGMFGLRMDLEVDRFIRDCEVFANFVEPAEITAFHDPIFEGAQGLLLSQCNMDMYPYLTPSHCGMRNVRELVWEGNFSLWDVYYVSRTYLTRHGKGPLPGEDHQLSYDDDTNKDHEWQGHLRFAPLDVDAMQRRIHADYENPKLIFTHCDQLAPPDWKSHHAAHLYSYGPMRSDVYTPSRKTA